MPSTRINSMTVCVRNTNPRPLRRNTNIPPGLLNLRGVSLRTSFPTSLRKSMAISAKTIIYPEAAHASPSAPARSCFLVGCDGGMKCVFESTLRSCGFAVRRFPLHALDIHNTVVLQWQVSRCGRRVGIQ